ncbi:hypothetical protein D9615_000211 [Tricholomella constricta]|uniref:Uncharacterized protein n=1 Tax=Tricholomella constricta TaxID=117010 RepID=A0A8H5MBG9_9AGAR|nr:hypothetical protein D9615_000211 [Tricholomella constricta]
MLSLFPQPGPFLPSFNTLLVKGHYHPSAPIHLSLSCTAEFADSQAILISPSRQRLTQALQHYNDEWLKLHSGFGSVHSLSSRVKLFYPPSPAHLCLLLSMLRVSSSSKTDNDAWLNPETTLSIPPSLVILHEPSAYFLSSDGVTPSKWTLCSYLSLITHALSSLTFLSGKGQERSGATSFALFDSRLDQLRLPIVEHPISQRDDSGENRSTSRLEPVYNYAQKYFEWIIAAEQEDTSAHGAVRKRTMALHRNDRDGGFIKSWEWWEGPDERQATRLIWEKRSVGQSFAVGKT